MKKSKKIVVLLILIVSFVFIIYAYKIIHDNYHIGIPCLFKKITNLYCPGCGITRAIFALLELDIKTAIRCNFLAFILMPFIIIYIVNYIYIWVNNIKKDASEIISKKTWYTLLVITIIFGIIRNLNYFDWLQPI